MWYAENPKDVAAFEKQMRRTVHYVVEPQFLWAHIVHLAKRQDGKLLDTLQKGFKFIEEESFSSNFQGLFSEINLASDKLGRKYEDRNARLCSIISEIARGMALFSTDVDTLGDAYEYLIGQFAAGSGKKAGEFYTPQQISSILSGIVTLDSRETNPAKKPSFDAVVANPPFSYRWEPGEPMGEDMRFKAHGVAPRSAADFAFLLHGLHYLKDDGVMAIILPHGVLFRGGVEERIRTKLLKDGHIDTVIGLPANLFYSTGISTCFLRSF